MATLQIRLDADLKKKVQTMAAGMITGRQHSNPQP